VGPLGSMSVADALYGNPALPPSRRPMPTGGSPPAPSTSPVSRAGADLMLLLLRANIPAGEMLSAKTDRDMALLAVKYGIELPRHLAHLPTLPPPKTEEERERDAKIAAETEAADNAHAEMSLNVKERPPRRARMRLGHASEVVDSPSATPKGSPAASARSPAPASPKQANAQLVVQAVSTQLVVDDAAAEQDLIGGKATKERAPSSRKTNKKGAKKEKVAEVGNGAAAADEPAASFRERASVRKPKKSSAKAGASGKLRDADFRELFKTGAVDTEITAIAEETIAA